MPDFPIDPNSDLPLPQTITPASGSTSSLGAHLDTITDAGSSVSGLAPQTSNSGTIRIEQARRPTELINGNVLDDYIDVIYNISLSLVSKDAVDRLRQDGVQSTPIAPSDYIVFASTGDVKTDSTTGRNPFEDFNPQVHYGGDYYNIQNLAFRSMFGHVPQNPLVSIIWDGKMQMFQPYGFSFREDMDEIATNLGYIGTTPAEFVYRLEVWFSGYDPATGRWTQNIDIPCPRPRGGDNTKLSSVVYYLLITTVEAKVTPTGTMYDLSFQTFSHTATRAEILTLHQDNVSTVKGNAKEQFRVFLQRLAERLHDQIFHDTQNKYKVKFEFVGFKELFDEPFIDDVSVDLSTGVTLQASSGSYAVSGKNIDLYTFLVHAMHSLQLVRALRLQEEDKNFIKPGVEWNIRTNIKRVENFDNDINAHKELTYQYIFEPHLHFRNRIAEVEDRNLQVAYENQRARAQAIVDYGMLYRVYNYYFTNQNSEIIDFQFRFKFFYYAPFPYGGTEVFLRGHGHNTDDRSLVQDQTEQKKEAANADQEVRDAITPSLNFSPGQSQDLATVLNIAIPQSPTNQKPPGWIFNHMHRGPAIPVQQGHKADKYATKNLMGQDMYLRYDMVDAQMTVRFDPTWLLNPYTAGRDSTSLVPLSDVEDPSIFVYAHTDRVIFLKAYKPNQDSYMNPDQSFRTKGNPMLGGFYAVVSVDNEFQGGRFFQKLNMYKYEHLNYFNLLASDSAASIPQFNTNQPAISEVSTPSNPGVTGNDPAATPVLG